MANELISVIVPIYNVEKYLQKCIDSILKQTYTNIEVILVDDGSPDNCGKICDDYKQLDHRISVIHKTNGGLSDARNVGIKESNGEFIVFVDSDDFINPNMIEILYNCHIKSEADIVICNFERFYENNLPQVNICFPEIEFIIFKPIEALKLLNTAEYKYQFTMAVTKLYKKKIFMDIKFPKGKLHEDTFVAHRILDKANKIAYTNLVFYYYLKREGSIMNSRSITKIDAVLAVEDRLNYYKNHHYDELIPKTLILMMTMICGVYSRLKCKNDDLYRNNIYLKYCDIFEKNYEQLKLPIRLQVRLKFFYHFPKLYKKVYNIVSKILVKRD